MFAHQPDQFAAHRAGYNSKMCGPPKQRRAEGEVVLPKKTDDEESEQVNYPRQPWVQRRAEAS